MYQTNELKDEPLRSNHMIFGYALANVANDASKEMDEDEKHSATVNRRLECISTINAHL